MKRPYYIYLPRNVFGEPLTGHGIHRPSYEIRATHTAKMAHANGKDLEELRLQTKELNDEHETRMAYAMHI